MSLELTSALSAALFIVIISTSLIQGEHHNHSFGFRSIIINLSISSVISVRVIMSFLSPVLELDIEVDS